MKRTGISFAGTAIVVTAGLYLLVNLGLISLNLPWFGDLTSTRTEVAQVTQAEITEVRPIALDCRARIVASVPLEGRKQHQVLGQTYRTDHVSMTAIGDIDTCVEADAVEISPAPDGSVRVFVPADAVRFERPRVDAVATLDSVRFSKGWVGKLTDAAPWVSETNELTPAAYAYAQSVIGSSDCMEQAWNVTRRVMVEAYTQQMVTAGGSADDIDVEIVGTPDFGQAETDFDDLDFEVAGTTLCAVDAGALDLPVDAAADES